MHLFFDTVLEPEEKKNTMENITTSICPKCGNDLSNLDRLHFGMCSKCFAYDCTKSDSGSVAAPKPDKELIADNPATYTHFDMLTMVARQTKHMFEENEQLREALKELIGVAKNYLDLDKMANPKSIEAIIDKARKLISK